MKNENASSRNFFVLADSHAKFISAKYSTSSYCLFTRSIPGLKWVDNYDRNFSVYALLSSADVQSALSQANAVLFLVGTNSVRILPALQIIAQVRELTVSVQKNYPHLSQSEKICLVSVPLLQNNPSFSIIKILNVEYPSI